MGKKRSVKFALKYFVAGSLFLVLVLLLAFQTESFT
jgi:hypothetical protein